MRDIKGERIWKGSSGRGTKIKQRSFFAHTNLLIENFFLPGELDEVWTTFPDPRPGKEILNEG